MFSSGNFSESKKHNSVLNKPIPSAPKDFAFLASFNEPIFALISILVPDLVVTLF